MENIASLQTLKTEGELNVRQVTYFEVQLANQRDFVFDFAFVVEKVFVLNCDFSLVYSPVLSGTNF